MEQNIAKQSIWGAAGTVCWMVLAFTCIAAAQSVEWTTEADIAPSVSTGSQARSEVHLFFSDDRNFFLKAEKRVLDQSGDPVADGRQLLVQLLQGPKERLHRLIPDDVRLRSFFLTHDGIAYADFSETLSENHPGGCRLEMLTIYSIVNTLILNIPEIKQVGILIAGQEIQTLAGHIDARFPFKADMLLIR
jgi:spore germination protein GerM